MSQFRENDSPSLQKLIDSYNDEIMRYSRMASPDAQPQSGQTGAEEHAELIGTRDYFDRQERGEPAEGRRYRQDEEEYAVKRQIDAEDGDEMPAVQSGTARNGASADEREWWLLELRQGLLELRRGMEELAQGQRELREGLLEYERGIAERGCRQAPNADPLVQPRGTASIQPAPLPDIMRDTPPAQSPESIPSDGVGYGELQTAVFTARRSLPIAGASVRIFLDTPQGRVLYASSETDADGKTPVIRLPAGTSSVPNADYASPFADYVASVSADGYYPRSELKAQIFSAERATLPVELTPLPDTGTDEMMKYREI